MNIACQIRRPLADNDRLPSVVVDCISQPTDPATPGARQLIVGRKDRRFWQVASYLLDVLDAHEGRLNESAGVLGISTGNFVRVLRSERHLLAAAQVIRKRHGQAQIT